MPTHALLGATGGTGGAILQYYLDVPPKDLKLNIFVRSKSKLLKSFPNLEQNKSFQVSITEGNLDNTDALGKSLADADVIFHCIATNDCTPGNSVARDSAKQIIAALKTDKARLKASYKKPTLLILRTATLNDALAGRMGLFVSFIHYALGNVYDDLEESVNMFKAAKDEDQDLYEYICVDPPALHAGGTRTGHKLILDEKQTTSINYCDLGAAFVEVAERKEEFIGKGVGVSATGETEEHWDVLRGYILRGLKAKLLGF